MKRLFAVAVVFASGLVLGFYFRGGSPTALAGEGGGGAPACSLSNGDVNASREVDLSDAVTILSFLFLGTPTALVPLCALPTGLPDTGQTTRYDADGNVLERSSTKCPGQDGSYATGCPSQGRFADNRDGTVTDTCTGLQWQQDAADVNGDGRLQAGEDFLPWCDALAYCNNLSFAGHDDWRLPNVRELQSIVYYGRPFPAIDQVFGALSSFYWSSTSYPDNPADAWYVDFFFGFGSVLFADKDGIRYVRAVRTAP